MSQLVLGVGLGLALCSCVASSEAKREPLCGGFSGAKADDPWVVAAADFAVKAQAKALCTPGKPVALALVKVLNAQQQVVAGMNVDLILQVKLDGKVKEARARVWRKLDGSHELATWTWAGAK
jgi:hypothetical protein